MIPPATSSRLQWDTTPPGECDTPCHRPAATFQISIAHSAKLTPERICAMQREDVCRDHPLNNLVKVTFELTDLRILATDPALLHVASDYAKRWHPATSLARAA